MENDQSNRGGNRGGNRGSNRGGGNHSSYWRENIRTIVICMAVWFVVSYGFGILFADLLDRIRFFGFKLGFWFAQQGSIYVFLALVVFYARRMNMLDRKHNVDETE